MEKFFALPLKQQHSQFRSYPFEKQYAIYMYSMEKRHPPDPSFAYDIAQQGNSVQPMLLHKLEVGRNEKEQERIIYVFLAMARQGWYDVKSDSSMMHALEAAVASMENETVRSQSSAYLAEIYRGSP
jgi:hypothetical protein